MVGEASLVQASQRLEALLKLGLCEQNGVVLRAVYNVGYSP